MGTPNRRKGPSREASPRHSRRHILAPLAIVLAGIVVYANSFGGPFLFDDQEGIVENPTIRRLWPLRAVLSPPRNTSVAGRPVANLAFALNYAIGGLSTRGYHVVNLAIHLAAGLVLFGIVRRTMQRALSSGDSHRLIAGTTKTGATKTGATERAAGTGLATAIAVLWVVHPLQTESVTYIVQRVESLMGLFYLLTLYAAIRYAQRPTAGWLVMAVVACALGMATKEVMVTAPVVVLLYDRAFVAGTFREALRRRWLLYVGLAATWGILAYLVAGAPRTATAGIGVKGVSPLTYATTQLGVIVHYLRLALWPHPLCLDYAWPLVTPAREVVGAGLAIAILVAATVWAVVRRPAAGFVGAWFLLILAPTSSFVTIKDAAFEHRMYLPLAGVVVAVVFVVHGMIRQFGGGGRSAARSRAIATVALVVAASALGGATVARNRDYESAVTMWSDVIAKRPGNPRGHFALGAAYAAREEWDEAIRHYQDALELDPEDARTHNNVAIVYAKTGRKEEAIAEYEKALALKPGHAEAHNNLGVLLSELGRTEEAIGQFRAALQSDSTWAGAHNNLGNALSKVGRLVEAAEAYRAALALEPDSASAHNNLAGLLIQLGRVEEAPAEYEAALRLVPASTVIRTNYADCLMRLGRKGEAAEEYRRVLAAQPNDAKVRGKLEAAGGK